MVNQIRELIKRAVAPETDFDVLVPPDPKLGDYSTNLAFVLAKKMGENPVSLANKLIEQIKTSDKYHLLARVDLAQPAFINFWLSSSVLEAELRLILKKKNKYGQGSSKKEKILLEFLSANPTGPLPLHNGRGGIYGDALANVLKFFGYKVKKEYYVNDAGNQIKVLGESILARLNIIPTKEEYYQGNYVGEIANKIRQEIEKYILAEDPTRQAEKIGRLAAEEFLGQIKKTADKIGIKFDGWFSENKKLRRSRLLDRILALADKKSLLVKQDGAVFLKTESLPLEETVLIKSNGEPTYLLADLAYHYDKLNKRKFNLAIDIWGADHHGYGKKLEAAMTALDLPAEKVRIIITQFIRLVEESREVKMSKRKGDFIALDEVIEKVGAAAARFMILVYSPDSHIDFDWQLAQKKSLENPVYYYQYSYVRALKIIEKAGDLSKTANKIDLSLLTSSEEQNLAKELIKFPDVIESIAQDYQVHALAQYVLKLSKMFSVFYENKRVIGETEDLAKNRLALVIAAKIVLENAAKLFGITLPESM